MDTRSSVTSMPTSRLGQIIWIFAIKKFETDLSLGVGGTPFTEDGGYDSTRDSFEGENYVAGPCQLFRHACWLDIGGYVANKAGGVDWIAVMTARMKGWDCPCLSREAIPPSPHSGNGRTQSASRLVLLRREGLLPRRLADLADIPRHLSDGEQALRFLGVLRPWSRLCLGGSAPDTAAGFGGTDALSPPRTNEKTGGDFSIDRSLPESGQFSGAGGTVDQKSEVRGRKSENQQSEMMNMETRVTNEDDVFFQGTRRRMRF